MSKVVENIYNKPVNNPKQEIPEEYRRVARGIESQFIQYMIEQMKRTIDRVQPDSSALKFYRSILNNHQANIMAEKDNGLGLQKIILDQIYPQKMRFFSEKDVVNSYRDQSKGDGVK